MVAVIVFMVCCAVRIVRRCKRRYRQRAMMSPVAAVASPVAYPVAPPAEAPAQPNIVFTASAPYTGNGFVAQPLRYQPVPVTEV